MSETESQLHATHAGNGTATDFFTIRQAAAYLGVHPDTISRHLPDIPGVVRLGHRTVRIPRLGFQAWLQKVGN